MFDPFYTTRRTEGGTGLGLSLAYGIVADHGGTIRAEHGRGSGLTVIIELPVAPQTLADYKRQRIADKKSGVLRTVAFHSERRAFAALKVTPIASPAL